ncbi:MAG: hypothetical protein ACRDQ0_17145, partial [Pseudonocardia sp.]
APSRTTPDGRHPPPEAAPGTGRDETFVGRVAGDDPGSGADTGAERRAEDPQRDEQDPDDRR